MSAGLRVCGKFTNRLNNKRRQEKQDRRDEVWLGAPQYIIEEVRASDRIVLCPGYWEQLLGVVNQVLAVADKLVRIY